MNIQPLNPPLDAMERNIFDRIVGSSGENSGNVIDSFFKLNISPLTKMRLSHEYTYRTQFVPLSIPSGLPRLQTTYSIPKPQPIPYQMPSLKQQPQQPQQPQQQYIKLPTMHVGIGTFIKSAPSYTPTRNKLGVLTNAANYINRAEKNMFGKSLKKQTRGRPKKNTLNHYNNYSVFNNVLNAAKKIEGGKLTRRRTKK